MVCYSDLSQHMCVCVGGGVEHEIAQQRNMHNLELWFKKKGQTGRKDPISPVHLAKKRPSGKLHAHLEVLHRLEGEAERVHHWFWKCTKLHILSVVSLKN